jgi:hypothetical protein
MASLTAGRIPRAAAAPSGGAQTLEDVPPGAAVTNPDVSMLPGNGAIGALTFSNPPTQAECEALRDACEATRDATANVNTALLAVLARLRVTGGNALIAD